MARTYMVKVRDLIKEIEAEGWAYSYSEGDHHHFVHPVLPGKITIPGHGRDDVRPGTLASVRRQAHIHKTGR